MENTVKIYTVDERAEMLARAKEEREKFYAIIGGDGVITTKREKNARKIYDEPIANENVFDIASALTVQALATMFSRSGQSFVYDLYIDAIKYSMSIHAQIKALENQTALFDGIRSAVNGKDKKNARKALKEYEKAIKNDYDFSVGYKADCGADLITLAVEYLLKRRGLTANTVSPDGETRRDGSPKSIRLCVYSLLNNAVYREKKIAYKTLDVETLAENETADDAKARVIATASEDRKAGKAFLDKLGKIGCTSQQLAVMALLVSGKTSSYIAENLGISKQRITGIKNQVLAKLNAVKI